MYASQQPDLQEQQLASLAHMLHLGPAGADLVKHVHPDMGVNSRAISILNSLPMTSWTRLRLSVTPGMLNKTAVRLVLPGEHAMSGALRLQSMTCGVQYQNVLQRPKRTRKAQCGRMAGPYGRRQGYRSHSHCSNIMTTKTRPAVSAMCSAR
jgi:hypothetical protein